MSTRRGERIFVTLERELGKRRRRKKALKCCCYPPGASSNKNIFLLLSFLRPFSLVRPSLIHPPAHSLVSFFSFSSSSFGSVVGSKIVVVIFCCSVVVAHRSVIRGREKCVRREGREGGTCSGVHLARPLLVHFSAFLPSLPRPPPPIQLSSSLRKVEQQGERGGCSCERIYLPL